MNVPHTLRVRHWLLSVLLCSYLLPSIATAEPVLVAKANFPLDSVTLAEISAIWLGKKQSLRGLGRVRVVDLTPDNPLYQQFYSNVVGLSGKPLEVHWHKTMFIGKSFRPKQVKTVEEVIQLVSAVPGVLGYIDSSSLTHELKALKIIQ